MPVLTPSSEEIRLYECTILLPTTLSEKELANALHAVEQIFEEKGATYVAKDVWGRQGLAYPIRRQREGQYVVYVYELKPEHVQAVDTAIRLEKSVLRHLVVKVPKHYEFTTFAERTQRWSAEEEKAEQEQEHRREEMLKQKIIQRAAKAAPAKEAPKSAEKVDIEKRLGDIISDEDLKL